MTIYIIIYNYRNPSLLWSRFWRSGPVVFSADSASNPFSSKSTCGASLSVAVCYLQKYTFYVHNARTVDSGDVKVRAYRYGAEKIVKKKKQNKIWLAVYRFKDISKTRETAKKKYIIIVKLRRWCTWCTGVELTEMCAAAGAFSGERRRRECEWLRAREEVVLVPRSLPMRSPHPATSAAAVEGERPAADRCSAPVACGAHRTCWPPRPIRPAYTWRGPMGAVRGSPCRFGGCPLPIRFRCALGGSAPKPVRTYYNSNNIVYYNIATIYYNGQDYNTIL